MQRVSMILSAVAIVALAATCLADDGSTPTDKPSVIQIEAKHIAIDGDPVQLKTDADGRPLTVQSRRIVLQNENGKPYRIELSGPPNDLNADRQRQALIGPPPPRSPYWIGVVCGPVDPALRAHLEIPEGSGVLVGDVMPDSPAEKAELRKYDILLTANGEPLNDALALIQAVTKAEEKPVTLELLRGGKKLKVDVTPAKRENAPPMIDVQPEAGGPFIAERFMPLPEHVRKQLEQYWPNDGTQPLRLHTIQPGVILPPTPNSVVESLSTMTVMATDVGDAAITITKQEGHPAKIVVRRDGQEIEATEDSIDDLPEDVRERTRELLETMTQSSLGVAPKLRANVYKTPQPTWSYDGQKAFQEQMDRMEQQMLEIQKQLDKLNE